MTTPERLERRLPELFDELAGARVPDYFDDLLRQTARTRQRPAWSSLERWFPVSEIARPAPLGLPSWRLIFVAIALLLVAVLGGVLLAGAAQTKLPPPFGPAQNGLIFYSTASQDLAAFDPTTGTSRDILTGSTLDRAPSVTADGRRIVFTRGPEATATLWVANIDGSGAREIPGPVPADAITDVSPDGKMVEVTAAGGLRFVDLNSFATSDVTLPFAATGAVWRSTTGQLVVTNANGSATTWSVVDTNGKVIQTITSAQYVVEPQPVISSDGSKLVYFVWSPADRTQQGAVHVVDIESGQDLELADGSKDYSNWEEPTFSPDGRQLLVWHSAPDGQYRLALLSTDGSTPPREIGNPHPIMTNGANGQFSPDGTKVLATYRDDGTTWLYDVATGQGTKVAWAPTEFLSWQRVP